MASPPTSVESFLVVIIVAAMVSGSLSFLASLTIIVMILRSNVKLSTTYRRLIFGLSAFDLIQSSSIVMDAILMPKGSMWSAIGNDVTCDIIGFVRTTATCGSVLYSVSISIYFLCIVKFEMEERKIQKYIEPFLHGVPILYSLSVNIYVASIDYFNPTGPSCWIEPPPHDDDGGGDEGSRQQLAKILRWLATGGPVFGAFFANCIILAMIWWTVYSQSKQMSQLHSQSALPPSNGQNQNRSQNRNRSQLLSPLAARLSRPSRSMMQILKETSNRATAYIIGYMMTYFFAIIYSLLDSYATASPPVLIVFLARLFFPAQGLFNMLIYTYPHVLAYRRRNEGTSWIRAVWEVVKSGGDGDRRQQQRRRSLPSRATTATRSRRRSSFGGSVLRTKGEEKEEEEEKEPSGQLKMGANFIGADERRIRPNNYHDGGEKEYEEIDIGNEMKIQSNVNDYHDGDEENALNRIINGIGMNMNIGHEHG